MQAKVYLVLAQLGESKASAIGKFAQVARADIYRVLDELEDLAMVEKIITKPLSFKVVPLQCVIPFLLARRDMETQNLKKRAQKLKERSTQIHYGSNLQAGFKFIEMSYTKRTRTLQQENNWQKIDIVTSWNRFIRWIIETKEDTEKLLLRGIKMRIVVSCPKAAVQLTPKRQYFSKLNALSQKSGIQIKYCAIEVPALLDIHDDRIVDMSLQTSPYNAGGIGAFLHSDHPSLVGMARMYFESLWHQAVEEFSIQ